MLDFFALFMKKVPKWYKKMEFLLCMVKKSDVRILNIKTKRSLLTTEEI